MCLFDKDTQRNWVVAENEATKQARTTTIDKTKNEKEIKQNKIKYNETSNKMRRRLKKKKKKTEKEKICTKERRKGNPQ